MTQPRIRRALALALAIDRGDVSLELNMPARGGGKTAADSASDGNSASPDRRLKRLESDLEQAREEIERLKALVSVLAFDPLPDGVTTRQQALHVLGFPPDSRPDRSAIRAKFRMLATIHHPDSPYGDHNRMSQLNAAMQILTRQVRP